MFRKQPRRINIYLRKMTKTFLPALLIVAVCTHAQQSSEDSLLTSGFTSYVNNIYNAQRENELPIYNGTFHYPYPSSIEGIAYFDSNDWQRGTVVYDGILYTDILMKYNMVADQLVVTNSETGSAFISLFNPRVKEFAFSGFKFILMDTVNTSLPGGFYQVLAEGKVTLLAKKTKTIWEQIVDNAIYRKFDPHTKYYILKDGEYHYVKNKNTLLALLKEKRSAVQGFLSQKSLNYRRETEKTIVSAVEFYNQ